MTHPSAVDPARSEASQVAAGHQPAPLQIQDLSKRPRFGCKGPGAPAWLEANGFSVPERANSAGVDTDGVLVARLATSEFLIEPVNGAVEAVNGGVEAAPSGDVHASASSHAGARRVRASQNLLVSSARPLEVYPVVRQDRVIGIHGPGMHSLLRQICSVDFAPLFDACESHSGSIALTSMMGVGVVAWPRRIGSGLSLTVWLDPSFGHYFWDSLLEVGRDLGVSVIGSNTI